MAWNLSGTMRTSLAFLLLALAACGDRQANSSSPVEEVPSLETAAIERGAIPDVGGIDPKGLYQRQHEGGTDTICLIPDGRREYRFGAAAFAGGKSRCAGRGRAKLAGQLLVMRFDKPSRCILIAQYEGDRLAISGAVDVECDRLCAERASFAGVAVPRVSASEGAARAVRSIDGKPLCRGG